MFTVAENHWNPKYYSAEFSEKLRLNLVHENNKRWALIRGEKVH